MLSLPGIDPVFPICLSVRPDSDVQLRKKNSLILMNSEKKTSFPCFWVALLNVPFLMDLNYIKKCEIFVVHVYNKILNCALEVSIIYSNDLYASTHETIQNTVAPTMSLTRYI